MCFCRSVLCLLLYLHTDFHIHTCQAMAVFPCASSLSHPDGLCFMFEIDLPISVLRSVSHCPTGYAAVVQAMARRECRYNVRCITPGTVMRPLLVLDSRLFLVQIQVLKSFSLLTLFIISCCLCLSCLGCPLSVSFTLVSLLSQILNSLRQALIPLFRDRHTPFSAVDYSCLTLLLPIGSLMKFNTMPDCDMP